MTETSKDMPELTPEEMKLMTEASIKKYNDIRKKQENDK